MAEWIMDIDEVNCRELLDSISKGKMYPGGLRSMNEATIARINGGIKVQVFSNEHPPPHFRVVLGGEKADFAIRDCRQINGGLGNWKHNIQDWHAKHKSLLIEKWNSSRPTGCPVGPYKE